MESSARLDSASAAPTFHPVPWTFGIQLLDGDVPSEAEKDRVATLGFGFFRKGMYWSKVERQRGVYDFSEPGYDAMLTGLMRRGLRPMITLFDGNPLYGETARSVRTEEGRAGFAAFAAATARHFPTGTLFEIWNEPNHEFFWTPTPKVDEYCALVAATAPAIRRITPQAKIMGPATAGPMIPFDWLEACFQRGLLAHLDYVCVHPYREGRIPPETVLPEYEKLRALIARYAPPGRSIEIVTGEWGFHTDQTPASTASPEVQAQYAARMFLLHLSLGMPLHSWFTWKDGTADPVNSDHYGLLDFAGRAKPSFQALQTLAAVLRGYSFRERLASERADIFLLTFAAAKGKRAYALWTSGEDTRVRLPLGGAQRGILCSMLGKRAELSWEAGGPEITVTRNPQYLLVVPSQP